MLGYSSGVIAVSNEKSESRFSLHSLSRHTPLGKGMNPKIAEWTRFFSLEWQPVSEDNFESKTVCIPGEADTTMQLMKGSWIL